MKTSTAVSAGKSGFRQYSQGEEQQGKQKDSRASMSIHGVPPGLRTSGGNGSAIILAPKSSARLEKRAALQSARPPVLHAAFCSTTR
jgi:hypothetical protein